ncbi:MAG: BatA and WFA domain-containing protein [Armatimonadota bacterium]|nr:MAG: BatA and WFA domain-containing protein [Armatimonadota bacterium]
MPFLLPLALLWAIPVVAVVIVLYLFRLRRQDRRVSSLMLWGQALREMQANAPFRRLRANWLMALQILAALGLVVALARPYVTVPGVSGRCVAVVLDTSASMRASDVRPSRFARAKAEAATLIQGLGRADEMCFVVAGAPTRVATPLTSDKSILRGALNTIEATDGPARGDEAIRLALSLIRGRSGGRVVVLSDGGFPNVEAAADTEAISFVRIGEGEDNVAIIALDARPGPDGRPLALASVRNFAKRKHTPDLEIRADGKLADVRQLSLPPGHEVSHVFPVPPGAQRVEVRLDVRDELAADNEAHLLASAGKQSSGVLLSKGNLFLQKALAVEAHVSFVRSSSPADLAAGRWDVYVLDRMCPDRLPERGGFLFIAAANAQAPVTASGVVRNAEVTRWDRDHPVTRWVDFADLRMEKAHKVAPRTWGKPLVFARETPLVVVGQRDGVRAIYVAWDLLDSDFPLRVGFPIFISNCMRWLAGDVGGALLANMRTGEVLACAPGMEAGSLEVTMPDGKTAAVPLRDGGAAVRLERVGVYEARAGDYRAVASANLLDAQESDITPRDALMVAGSEVAAVGKRPRRTHEYWRWAVLAVLALFALEWMVYHRRI